MFESDLCNFFVYGFFAAGVLGFIAGRLRLLSNRAAQARKKTAVIEIKHSPREVYMSSVRANIEIIIWFTLIILIVVIALVAYWS